MDKRELKEHARNMAISFQMAGEEEIKAIDLDDLDDLIDQLDEPEMLSQKWLREHLTDGHNVDLGDAVVFVDDLQNLLVPKQELPVIPQFVGERIKEYKELKYGLSLAFNIDGSIDSDVRFSKWLSKKESNGDLFARAWLGVYTVEEKKYRVVIGNYVLRKWNNRDAFQMISKNSPKENNLSGCKIELTEKEIKATDERFWPFAVPVEEEEE